MSEELDDVEELSEVEDDESQIAAEVLKKPASSWLLEQYLPFTIYAIRSRALVADDGLKPVNRRILYSLFKEGITPNAEHLKAARAAANAVAFHPHGSSSVEDALARMAQNFSLRVPLIDPYGSVGFVTGDTPAAARYWECRLSREAMELLKELPDGSVPIGKNFDGKLDEPGLLPVRWPVNIINGTQGIAVGYASNMFSHNPDEVMKAAIAYLKNPELTVKRLLKIMPGPDLPTGGELFETDGVTDYYKTGSGRFTIRGRYEVEQMTRGKVRIIFYELPYQISATDVIIRIRSQQERGRLKDIATVKDLTDRKNGLRLVIETKSGTNHLNVLNQLFKYTSVESKFSVNNTVLIDGHPKQVGMLELIGGFVEFRKQCILRRSETRADKIDRRIHQLNAILAALIDIDKCIAIIRKSESADDARTKLMAAFKLDEEQADYILSMQLRRLTKADAVAIKQENDELLLEKKDLEEIQKSSDRLNQEVEREFRATLKVISNERRTVITGLTSEELKQASKEVAQEARDVEKNLPCYITRFVDGRIIKTDEPFKYRPTLKKWKYSPIAEQIKTKTQDDLILVGNDGTARRIPMRYVAPDYISKPKDAGVHFDSGVELVAIAKGNPLKTDVGLMLATKLGEVKLVRPDLSTKEEFVIYNLSDDDEIIDGRWIGRTLTDSYYVSITSDAKILSYDASSVRATGVNAGGVRSQRVADGEHIVSFNWVPSLKDDHMIISQTKKTIKATFLEEIPPKSRGAQGVALHKFTKDEGRLIKAFVGKDVILGMSGANNTVTLPPVSRRAVAGTDFNIETLMGVADAAPM